MATGKSDWSKFADFIESQIRELHRITGIGREYLMSEDLPKQELLLKLLKMTTSNSDGEALVAMRKANALLTSAGWDWDKLIHGKIKVIEDPFKNTLDPFADRGQPMPRPRPAPAPRPQPAARPAPPPPPPPPPKPRPAVIASTKSNIYAGWCYCCGDPVLGKDGFIFDPQKHNSRANSKWQIVCKSCNASNSPNVGPTAFPRQRPLGNATPGLGDI